MRTTPRLTVPLLAATLALSPMIGGCAGGATKTQQQAAREQWDGARASVLFGLARDQYQAGSFDKSRETLGKALLLEPTNAKLHVLSAKLAIEQGQLELADRELKTAREEDPKDAEAQYLSGVVCQRWQKLETAYFYYSQACDNNPNELAYLMAKAETLVAMDRAKEALSLLEEKVVFFEHSAVIRDATGQLLVQQCRYADAVDMLRQASILANDDESIREHLAMALCLNKQYREGCDLLARLLKDPKNEKRADLYLAQGECDLQLNHLSEARGSYEMAAQLNPSSQQAWTGLAKTALQANDLRRAELALRKTLALNGNDAQVQLLVGYLRVRQNKLPEALTAFQAANKLDPHDTVSLCMIGYVLEKSGQPTKAMECYARALKIRPNDDMATKMMASVDVNE